VVRDRPSQSHEGGEGDRVQAEGEAAQGAVKIFLDLAENQPDDNTNENKKEAVNNE
jgi:hypothetical protein